MLGALHPKNHTGNVIPSLTRDLSVCSVSLCKEILRQAQNDKLWFFGWSASIRFLTHIALIFASMSILP